MDAPTDRRTRKETDEAFAPMQPAPAGLPYTVLLPDGDGYASADLEHPSHLPRIGDKVEYIDEGGAVHRYVVEGVIHTYQAGHAGRPTVDERGFTPASLAREMDGEAEAPGSGGSIRAGLPQVVLAPEPPATRMEEE